MSCLNRCASLVWGTSQCTEVTVRNGFVIGDRLHDGSGACEKELFFFSGKTVVPHTVFPKMCPKGSFWRFSAVISRFRPAVSPIYIGISYWINIYELLLKLAALLLDGLGALRHGVLGQLTGEDEAQAV